MSREAVHTERATRWSMMCQSVDRFEAAAVVCSTELGRAYANEAAAGEGWLTSVIHAMGLAPSGRNGVREAGVRPIGDRQAGPVGARRAWGLPVEIAVESSEGRSRFLVADVRDAQGRSVGWLATFTGVEAAPVGSVRAVTAIVG